MATHYTTTFYAARMHEVLYGARAFLALIGLFEGNY